MNIRRNIRQTQRPKMRTIRKSLKEEARETSASDHFPPGKVGVMGRAYKDPRTA